MADRQPPRWNFPVLWHAIGAGLILVVILLSLLPPAVPLDPVLLNDKVGHALAYGCLMAWHAQLFEARAMRAGYAIGFVLMGIALEEAQALTGYRRFDIADMVANTAGVAAGWLSGVFGLKGFLRWLDTQWWERRTGD